jgi:archaellum component FlaC
MERPKFEEEKSQIEEGKSGGMKLPSGIAIYIVMVIVALVASFSINLFFGVSKSGLDKQVAEITASVDATKSDIRAIKDSVTTATNNIPTTIQTQITSQLSTYTSKLTTLEATIETIKSQSNTATSQSNNAISQLADLNKQIADLKASIVSMETSIKNLTAKVDAIVLPTTTPTTIPTTPTTGVIISVVNTSLPLKPPLYDGTFNLKIDNKTGNHITGGQITFTMRLTGTLATGETINTVLPLSSLSSTNNFITFTSISYPITAYVVGDYNDSILSGGSKLVSINVALDSLSLNNLTLVISDASYIGYVSY